MCMVRRRIRDKVEKVVSSQIWFRGRLDHFLSNSVMSVTSGMMGAIGCTNNATKEISEILGLPELFNRVASNLKKLEFLNWS